MIDESATLIDVAFAVCTALHDAGIAAVLCGGSAATFYAPEAYMSMDADFVARFDVSRKELATVLAPLSFAERGRIFVHDRVTWTVDFPPGPLAVGRELVASWETVRRGEQLLHVVSALRLTASCRRCTRAAGGSRLAGLSRVG